METIPLEMDDIFGDDEEDVLPTRLPDIEELLEGGLEPMRDSRFDESNELAEAGEESIADNPDLLNKLKSLKGASKDLKKRTHIKLDAARLTGERGIPALPKVFKDIKLKGKHHEAEDLKTIMHNLEHWAHRLFPKMTFSEVLERTERLGAKTEVKTCIKKIRLGMPVLGTEIEEEEEDIQRGDKEEDMGEEEEEPRAIQRQGDTTNNFSHVPNDDEIDELLNTQMEINQAISQSNTVETSNSASASNETTTSIKSNLSEETRLRIEKNKKLALERRAARLSKGSSSQDVVSSLPAAQPLPSSNERIDEPNLQQSDVNIGSSSLQDQGKNNSEEQGKENVNDNKETEILITRQENGLGRVGKDDEAIESLQGNDRIDDSLENDTLKNSQKKDKIDIDM